jgi:PRTRC genetic system protein C
MTTTTPTAAPTGPRVFKYGEHTWRVDNPAYTTEQARAQLAAHFPELRNATVEVTEQDGVTTVEFRKQAGSLGGGMTAAAVAARLPQRSLHLLAAELLFQFGAQELTATQYAALQGRIEEAYRQLSAIRAAGQQVIAACQRLLPTPSRLLPPGF